MWLAERLGLARAARMPAMVASVSEASARFLGGCVRRGGGGAGVRRDVGAGMLWTDGCCGRGGLAREGVVGRDRPRSGDPGPGEGAEDADTNVSSEKVDEDRRAGGMGGADGFGRSTGASSDGSIV